MKEFTETRTTTFKPEWVRKDWAKFSEFMSGRSKRSKSSNDKLSKCFKCKTPFKDDDTISLASFGSKGNKMLCTGCADFLTDTSGDK